MTSCLRALPGGCESVEDPLQLPAGLAADAAGLRRCAESLLEERRRGMRSRVDRDDELVDLEPCALSQARQRVEPAGQVAARSEDTEAAQAQPTASERQLPESPLLVVRVQRWQVAERRARLPYALVVAVRRAAWPQRRDAGVVARAVDEARVEDLLGKHRRRPAARRFVRHTRQLVERLGPPRAQLLERRVEEHNATSEGRRTGVERIRPRSPERRPDERGAGARPVRRPPPRALGAVERQVQWLEHGREERLQHACER